MKSIITAVIIEKDEHDYSELSSRFYFGWPDEQCFFDVIHLTSCEQLYETLSDNRTVDAIITIGEIDLGILSESSFEIRKKWCHFDSYNASIVSCSIISTFIANIRRERPGSELFSIFTSTYCTPHDELVRLYESIKNQTYHNWNWYIIDDSLDNDTIEFVTSWKDPRVIVFKNISNHGSIGFNKHAIAMIADGDYLLEVDHDDELTDDCLEMLKLGFDRTDADFVYADGLELIDNEHDIWYGEPGEFSCGCGNYRREFIKDRIHNVTVEPDINCATIRAIYAQPNHPRCWKASFYRNIAGHYQELSVLDDMELIIQTFLHGKMTKVNKTLYIQHESGNRSGGEGTNTQSKRFNEIQRTNLLLEIRYDKEIHDRILELGGEDVVWDEESQSSFGYFMHIGDFNLKDLKRLNEQIDVPLIQE